MATKYAQGLSPQQLSKRKADREYGLIAPATIPAPRQSCELPKNFRNSMVQGKSRQAGGSNVKMASSKYPRINFNDIQSMMETNGIRKGHVYSGPSAKQGRPQHGFKEYELINSRQGESEASGKDTTAKLVDSTSDYDQGYMETGPGQ